jgi:hypothetical protein
MVKTPISKKIKPNSKNRVIANKEIKLYNLSMFGKSQRWSTGRAVESDPKNFSTNES